MRDGDGNEVPFDLENIMAEIKVAAPELVQFLQYCATAVEEDAATEEEMQSVLELVYSFAKWKNEDEEARMIEGRE